MMTIGAFVPGDRRAPRVCAPARAAARSNSTRASMVVTPPARLRRAATRRRDHLPSPGRMPSVRRERPRQRDGTPHGKAFVDLQNDVTTQDLRIATREGFRSIEHVKRYTTAGMATDQGKTSNINALATVAALLQQPIPAVGHTTFRMPYTPVTFGTLAGAARGALLEPVRQTPLHDWAAAHGAVFEDVGTWKRARCFPRPARIATRRRGARMPRGAQRGRRAGRQHAGQDRSRWSGCRGIPRPALSRSTSPAWRRDVAATRCCWARTASCWMTASSPGLRPTGSMSPPRPAAPRRAASHGGLPADRIFPSARLADLDHRAMGRDRGARARARDALAPLVEGIDLAAMPHMSVRAVPRGRRRGALVPRQLHRRSWVTRSTCRRASTQPVWDALLAAGAPFDITPYGTEAMHVLRAEKGFIIVGQETDGTVTPDDLGLGVDGQPAKARLRRQALAAAAGLCRTDRRQLVGLLTSGPACGAGRRRPARRRSASRRVPAAMLGHVTSAYWSETLQRSIALALVAGGRGADRQHAVCADAGSGHSGHGARSRCSTTAKGARLHG